MSNNGDDETAAGLFHSARIFIVDDEPHNITIISRFLNEAGYQQIMGVTDPREAIEKYEAWQPDMVLLDLRMPHVDGFTLLTHLRAHSSPTVFLPILVLTSDWTSEARHRALACGATDFLTRPLDSSEVVLRVSNLLSTRALQLQLARQNESLEADVHQRMADLLEANERLRNEIEARERAESALRRHDSFVHLLEVITVAASQSAPVHQTFQVALDEVCSSMNWVLGHALKRAHGGPLVTTGLWHAQEPERFAEFKRVSESEQFMAGMGLPGRVLSSGQPAWIVDLTGDINFRRAAIAKELGLVSGFAVPILVGTEVSAVLEFFSERSEVPDPEMLDLMHHIGAQLGRVLERQRSEEALRSSEAKFRSLVQLGSDAIVLGDQQGRIISWNRGAQQIFGYPEDEALGRSLLTLLPEHARPELAAGPDLLSRLEVQRLVGRTHEMEGRRKDGSVFPIELSGDIWTTWDGTFCSAVIRDVTGRRRMEESLRQIDDRLRHLLEATKIIPWSYDREHRAGIYIGPQIADLLGFPVEDWYAPDFWVSHIHVDDRDWLFSHVREALERTGSFEIEYRLVAADGRHVWVHSIGCTPGADRTVVSGFLLDISAARQAQEVTRRYAAVFEFSNDAIVIANLDAQIVSWNRGCERLFGYTAGEMVGSKVTLLHPNGDGQEWAHFREQLVRGQHLDNLETTLRRKDRSLVEVSLTVSPIQDAHGRTTGVCGIVRDISERKRAEEELRRSHDRLESLVTERTAELREANTNLRGEIDERLQTERALLASQDRWKMLISSMEEIVFEFDAQGHYVNLWSGQRELLQELNGTVAGQGVPEIFGHGLATPILATIARVIETGRPETLEHTFDLPLGRRWFLSRVAPLTDPHGQRLSVCLFARDITDRKQWEEALREAKEAAERANSAKTEFLSRMSHELRTPLNSILGFAQLIDRQNLTHEDCDGLEQILTAGDHLLALINEVLDMARIEVGRLTLALEPVHIGEVVQETVALVRPQAVGRQVTIDCAEADFELVTDRQRLRQVLLNLLSNALKFNVPGGSVRIATERMDGAVRIAVSDTGRGIQPEKIALLFKAFERLETGPGSTEGIGLGLAISKRLVELMGGEIGVTSVPDEGSTFWFTLPLAEISAPALAELPQLTLRPGGSHTILYIEDNLANLKLVERILARQEGLQLLAATSGQPGLELALEHQPALILLDLRLPDLDGEQVLERLRADPRTARIPVILTSAEPRSVTEQRLGELEIEGYLNKPFELHEFIVVVNAVLARPAAVVR
jgi:PAS domain S-box-containing protein